MKFSEISTKILQSNNITDDRLKDFIKQLRVTLRLDYEIPAKEVRKMNDNKVIEVWYENNLQENICGS